MLYEINKPVNIDKDIRQTLHYLGEITGDITTDDLPGNIFKKFCIEK